MITLGAGVPGVDGQRGGTVLMGRVIDNAVIITGVTMIGMFVTGVTG